MRRVTILGKNDKTTPWRLNAEMSFSDGQERQLELKWASRKGLTGNADLGEISIDIEKIKTIGVLKP